jgi:hypothetical protein
MGIALQIVSSTDTDTDLLLAQYILTIAFSSSKVPLQWFHLPSAWKKCLYVFAGMF